MIAETMLIPWPQHWLDRRNGGQLCDMAIGPCACGAWHTFTEYTPAQQAELRDETLYVFSSVDFCGPTPRL